MRLSFPASLVLVSLAVSCGSRTGILVESTQADSSTPASPVSECPGATGVQPGSPWPTPRRCPTNAASSPLTFASTPHVQWSTPLPSPTGLGPVPFAPAPLALAADGTIYLGTGDGLLAVDASGRTRWQVLRGTSVYALFIGSDGTVYVAAGDDSLFMGVVTAVRPSGKTAWTFSPPCGVAIAVVPGLGDDLYVLAGPESPMPTSCTGGASVASLHSDGSVAWTWDLPELSSPGPSAAVGTDGTLYMAVRGAPAGPNLSTTTLVALSPQGSPVWRLVLPAVLEGPQLLLAPNGTLYATYDSGGSTAAVSPQGKLLWTQPVSALAIGTDGRVYAMGGTDFDDELVVALRADGSTAWQWNVGDNGGVGASLIVGPDALYVPGCGSTQDVCGGTVVALDLASGMPLWSAGTDTAVALMTGTNALYAITQGDVPNQELVAIGE